MEGGGKVKWGKEAVVEGAAVSAAELLGFVMALVSCSEVLVCEALRY